MNVLTKSLKDRCALYFTPMTSIFFCQPSLTYLHRQLPLELHICWQVSLTQSFILQYNSSQQTQTRQDLLASRNIDVQATEEGKKGRKQHAYSTASTESHGCTGAEQVTRLLFSTHTGVLDLLRSSTLMQKLSQNTREAVGHALLSTCTGVLNPPKWNTGTIVIDHSDAQKAIQGCRGLTSQCSRYFSSSDAPPWPSTLCGCHAIHWAAQSPANHTVLLSLLVIFLS